MSKATADLPWINPIGGYGDILMISGALKLALDNDPDTKYNLLRRTKYLSILGEHPAIAAVGFPPKGSKIQRVDYWSMEEIGPDLQRPFQILCRGFGLSTPQEEKLYIPGEPLRDPLLMNILPWKKLNVLIAPASESPRKIMPPIIWHHLVERLLADGMFVAQAGRISDQRIRNAYSVLGLTNVHELVALVKACDLVVTSDNFIMHAAHMVGTPAVVVWGPTNHQTYGYPEQVHLQMPKQCGLEEFDECIAPKNNRDGMAYSTPCPMGEKHCLAHAHPEGIFRSVKKTLLKSPQKTKS